MVPARSSSPGAAATPGPAAGHAERPWSRRCEGKPRNGNRRQWPGEEGEEEEEEVKRRAAADPRPTPSVAAAAPTPARPPRPRRPPPRRCWGPGVARGALTWPGRAGRLWRRLWRRLGPAAARAGFCRAGRALPAPSPPGAALTHPAAPAARPGEGARDGVGDGRAGPGRSPCPGIRAPLSVSLYLCPAPPEGAEEPPGAAPRGQGRSPGGLRGAGPAGWDNTGRRGEKGAAPGPAPPALRGSPRGSATSAPGGASPGPAASGRCPGRARLPGGP